MCSICNPGYKLFPKTLSDNLQLLIGEVILELLGSAVLILRNMISTIACRYFGTDSPRSGSPTVNKPLVELSLIKDVGGYIFADSECVYLVGFDAHLWEFLHLESPRPLNLLEQLPEPL